MSGDGLGLRFVGDCDAVIGEAADLNVLASSSKELTAMGPCPVPVLFCMSPVGSLASRSTFRRPTGTREG